MQLKRLFQSSRRGRLAIALTVATMVLGATASSAAPVNSGSGYHAVVPVRVLDTRIGVGAPAARVMEQQTLTLTVSDLPNDANAVALNVTAVGGSDASHMILWGPGSIPTTSTVNWLPGITVANSAVVAIDSTHAVHVWVATGSVDVVVDLLGYYSPGPLGLPGPVGPAGPAGPAGADGAVGPAGADGAVGPVGPIGETGPAGADGAVGPAGADGAVGPAGPIGETGATGADGATGPAGADGAVGPVGPIGETGATGADGAVGPAGADGAVGPIGETGATGADGAVGPAGPIGETGATGADGATGPAGADGAVGPAGADGAVGPVGPAGPIGDTGATGADGAPGLPGADGAPGLPGADGAPGPAGADGAVGPVGPAGPTGADGAPGVAGPQGEQGPAGADGTGVNNAFLKASSSAGQTIQYAGAVAFANNVLQSGITANEAVDSFTVPSTGIYLISTYLLSTATSQVQITVNGNPIAEVFGAFANTPNVGSTVLQLSAGDVVSLLNVTITANPLPAPAALTLVVNLGVLQPTVNASIIIQQLSAEPVT